MLKKNSPEIALIHKTAKLQNLKSYKYLANYMSVCNNCIVSRTEKCRNFILLTLAQHMFNGLLLILQYSLSPVPVVMRSLLFQMWRLCLRVMLIAVICVCALPEKPSVMSKLVRKRETQQRYCGSRLVNILKILCQSKYYSMDERMRRDTEFFHSRSPQGVV